MSRKIVLIAGVLLAAGTVAALSAPHFRGGHHRHSGILGDGPGQARFGERLGEQLKEMDADKDGAVTLDEFLSRRSPTFARLDKNGDGVVDAAEFDAATKESSDYWTRRFLKRFDADKDGKISQEEFARARKERFALRDLNDDGRLGLEDMPPGKRERHGRWREDRAADGKEAKDGPDATKEAGKDGGRFTLDRLLGRTNRQFARLDKNGDGFIDTADLATLATERATHGQQRFFRRFDADRDGKVTRDEFNRFSKERFANLDLDDDGKITETDLPPTLRGRGLLR